MANRLADMHQVAPELTDAVARRITSSDLHDKAQRDLGAFVHRTVIEDEHTYAVRIDDGAMLDAAEQIEHARAHLTPGGPPDSQASSTPTPDKLDAELDTLTARARARALKLRITPEIRDRARTGRYAYVHDRGQDFAAGIWVVDPVFMIDLARDALTDRQRRARPRRDLLRRRPDRRRRAPRRRRAGPPAKAAGARTPSRGDPTNLGLGHDIRAGLLDPTAGQLQALKQIICHLLAHHYREVIAYGAGWTDHERQQPVGDTGRHEPRHTDAILNAELDRALADPDPLRGIAQLTARWAAAFVLHPDGVTRTKALGTERMARKL